MYTFSASFARSGNGWTRFFSAPDLTNAPPRADVEKFDFVEVQRRILQKERFPP